MILHAWFEVTMSNQVVYGWLMIVGVFDIDGSTSIISTIPADVRLKVSLPHEETVNMILIYCYSVHRQILPAA